MGFVALVPQFPGYTPAAPAHSWGLYMWKRLKDSGVKVNLRVDLNSEAVTLDDFLGGSDLLSIQHCTTKENSVSFGDS